MSEKNYEEIIGAFHQMWDGFPGIARLISKEHIIIAANPIAIEKGYLPGLTCATIGAKEMHRGCKFAKTFQTGQAQTDNVLSDRIRGWMPVQGYPELIVHFAVMIPDE